MKKIINGLRYDTSNSTEIGRFNNGLDRDDFQFWEAALYITPHKKHYFIVGEGGPMTRYGVVAGRLNEWKKEIGERLDPISKENAFEWAKVYLSPGESEKHFADMMDKD